MSGPVARLILSLLATAGLLILVNMPLVDGFRIGPLFEPWNGLYRTARTADRPSAETPEIPGLESSVRIIRDDRSVPHIFAENDLDAVTALGFAVAQDRLFQIDFIRRVASGRLASVLGIGALETDQYFVGIGLRWAAKRQAQWIREEDGLILELITRYQNGVNAFIHALKPEDDPFEFRILGYRPQPLTVEDAIAVFLYMTFDLSYTTKDFSYTQLKSLIPEEDYSRLFPINSKYVVPIVHDDIPREVRFAESSEDAVYPSRPVTARANRDVTAESDLEARLVNSPHKMLAEGLIAGKGSNNWAVDGNRSSTGYPILAGDMHLNLSLPAIWYEAHLVTPTMNVYGVTIPGAPAIVEGITSRTAWAYTNTGSDQIDHYVLSLDEKGDSYLVDDQYEPFEWNIETIEVARSAAVVDTLRISRYGPVRMFEDGGAAIRWTAYDSSRTIAAIWGMARASNYEAFQQATSQYGAPMQNILYADRSGTIAIRSTGYAPIRGEADGSVSVDGSNSRNDWQGRIPFAELPASVNPNRGYLTSTNQQPAEEDYLYYLGMDWRDAFRSMRIDELLASKSDHTVADFQSYQADVHAVQADLFLPLLAKAGELTDSADQLRSLLEDFDGEMTVDRPEPYLFHVFLENLERLAWDEGLFEQYRSPSTTRLYRFLTESPESIWLDVLATPEKETGADLIKRALEEAAQEHWDAYQSDPSSFNWGDRHKLVVRHITQSGFLRALDRGPFAYPGYRATLSPAGAMRSTHSASWRVIVDFSSEPPSAFGVYPGGQNGNPFSTRYDEFIDTYLNFDYYALFLPDNPEQFGEEQYAHEVLLRPLVKD